MIKGTDISFVLSGGETNTDANKSLGGYPSYFVVENSINSLFSDVSMEQSKTGLTDYRCIYVFNNNLTDFLYNTKVFIKAEYLGGSDITIGLPIATDIQKIIVTGLPDAGSYLTISYYPFDILNSIVVPYNVNFNIWAQDIQDGLNNLPSAALSGIQVGVNYIPQTPSSPQVITFTILFLGNDNNKNHPLLEGSLTTGSSSIVVFEKVRQGGPINTITSSIAYSTTPPTGIDFSYPMEQSAIILGTFGPTEGFPVWFRRQTAVQPDAMLNDGVVLAINGSPIE
jgi:hypothetical protein